MVKEKGPGNVRGYSKEEIQFLRENIDLNKGELTAAFNKRFRYENWLTAAQKPKSRAAIETTCTQIRKGYYDN